MIPPRSGAVTHPDREWKEIKGVGRNPFGHMYSDALLLLLVLFRPCLLIFGTTQVGWGRLALPKR